MNDATFLILCNVTLRYCNSNNDLRKQQRMTSNAPALLDYNSPRIV